MKDLIKRSISHNSLSERTGGHDFAQRNRSVFSLGNGVFDIYNRVVERVVNTSFVGEVTVEVVEKILYWTNKTWNIFKDT